MIIYIVDRQLNILGQASTNLPSGHQIVSDSTVESVETGVNTFNCSISYDKGTRAEVESLIQVGRYILKQSGRSTSYDSLYQIVETETDTLAQEVHLYAEDAGMDLLNKVCGAVTLTGDITSMMRYFLPSDWSLSIISAPTNTYSWTWDGESTCTERLMSVAGIFGCEIYYSFDIDKLRVTAKRVNVVKKRGSQKPVAELRLNYDINRIYTKTSIANLVTALNVTGGTPEGSETPINLVGYTYSYTDPTTKDVYMVDTATGQMRNTSAMKRWSSALDSDGLWLGSFQFDTTDQSVLAGQARARLQELSAPIVNYEVDFSALPKNVRIGDRVMIIDDAGALYLEARVLQIETSASADTQTAIIGEYLLRNDGLSGKVLELNSQLQSQISANQANQIKIETLTDTLDSMTTLEVTSETFANYTTLTAHAYRGSQEITSQFNAGQFKWLNRSEEGEAFLGRGYSITINMEIVGYASTVLLKLVRPQLYDWTDHNGNDITDENLDPIQVAYAGIYTPPATRRRTLRATTQIGTPTVTREVNLYEKDGMSNLLLPLQHFWADESGIHVTETTKDEYLADTANAGGNLHITAQGVQVRDGNKPMAYFHQDGVQVGADDDSHIGMGKASIIGFNSLGRSYFTMRDAQGMTHQYDAIGNGVQTSFTFGTTNPNAEIISGVTVDEVEVTDYTVTSDELSPYRIEFTTAPASGAVISLFTEQTEFAPTFSFGSNTFNAQPPFSMEVGEGCQAQDKYCVAMGNASSANGDTSFAVGNHAYATGANGGTAVSLGDHTVKTGIGCALGIYNDSESGSMVNHLLQVGNGTDDENRSNALTLAENGDLYISGTLTQTSDRRLKEHIGYLGADANEFIRELKPAHFKKDGQDHVGFYAQDVEESDKWNCMTDNMNGFKTLTYSEIIAPLVAYCQHLEARIAELEKK